MFRALVQGREEMVDTESTKFSSMVPQLLYDLCRYAKVWHTTYSKPASVLRLQLPQTEVLISILESSFP